NVPGYTEGVGTNYEPITAIHRLGDGSYEWDTATNSAKIEATYWSWWALGIGSSNANANTRVWAGVASFLSNQSWWLGPNNTAASMGMAAYYPSASYAPTVNGASAAGYITQLCPAVEPYNPLCSRAYEALYSKGIDGQDHDSGATYGPRNGETFDVGQLLFLGPGKDVAAPFWLPYQTKSMAWAIANHSDGFWMDNTTG